MANRITWAPSVDVRVTDYIIEVAQGASGPWVPLATISDNPVGNPNYDATGNRFFYIDNASAPTAYYRLTAIDSASSTRSLASTPFQPIVPPTTTPAGAYEFNISVADVDTLLALGFSKIEIWCSTDEGASYQELTASDKAYPVLKALPANTEYRVGGYSMSFKLDGGPELTVRFDQLLETATAVQVAELINDVSPGLATVSNNTVVLTGPTSGRCGAVEITYCDAHDLFAEPVIVRGLDARISLSPGVYLYTYFDVAGSLDFRYKWRFSNDGSLPISSFSERGFAQSGRVPDIATAVAITRFIDAEGRPYPGRVIAAPVGGDQVAGFLVGGNVAKTYVADENGLLQIQLVQGARMRIAIEGTDIIKEITVPALAAFDLLQEMGAAPDQFTVQTTEPFLTRRSL